ncbi:recombinase family protein [Arthrobacter gandavensis]|uniref:Recombinase family protein n=2 Tax=Arthrobacter TaxID=1663 RepID=A0ABP5ABK2_9MICC
MDATGERWGVETQRRKIAELSSARDWQIVEWYEDNDVSASKPRGPKSDWARMLRDAEAGQFELVVAVDIDRLLRSTRDMNTLMDTGVNVATVDGEIDLSTADGEMRAGFLTIMARFETRRKSERQLRSNARRRAEGIPASAWTPFGWTKDGELIPEQAAAVRRAFDAFLGEPSLSIRRIREDLNSAGHRTARNSAFSIDAVRYLLANPLYAGFIKKYSTGELFPVQGEKFPSIVSEPTWRAAVVKLEDNVRRAGKQGNQPKYLLSSVGLCGKCGATLVSGNNSRGVGTYKCGVHFHLSRQRDPVDAMVIEAVLTRLSAVDVHDLVAPPEDVSVDREALLSERKALVERIEELTPLLADIRQPVKKISEGLALAQARITELDVALLDRTVSPSAGLLAGIDDPAGTRQRHQSVARKWEALDMDRRRMLVNELVTVTIDPIQPGHVKFDPDLVRIEARRN